MAEDIDKLIERLRYIRADILGRAEREYGRVPTEDREDAACVEAASAAIKALRSRVSELEAERDRALRNRDMWKGQSERQAATLHGLRISVHTAIVELAALVPNPRCVGNSDWPEFLNAADRQCLTDAYDALDATRSNGAAAPTAPAAVGGDVEALIVAAYERGAEWANENVGNGEFLSKAARDYADATMSELQRERGAVSAATLSESETVPTASDDLVEEVAVAIRNTAPRLMERDVDRIARAVLSSPPVREIAEALDNINMQAVPGPTEGWAMIPKTEWDALDIRSILSRFQSVGGDDVDASSSMGSQAALRAQEGE